MTAANRIAVEVQRAIGPLFDRRVLESGPLVTPGDHAGVSEGGRSHGRSREQGEAKKCAHGLNRGARKAGTPQLLTMIAVQKNGVSEPRGLATSAGRPHASGNPLNTESQEVTNRSVGLRTIRHR